MGVIDDDIELKTDVSSVDPLTSAAETAWLEYAKGTWSETDRRIFVEGFRRGWYAKSKDARETDEAFLRAR